MLVVGNTIKMVKSVGPFVQGGTTFAVTKIQDGIIYFNCNMGTGCMSYNEFNEYFEVEQPKREWTEWAYNPARRVWYKTNGKKVKVLIPTSQSRQIGIASCHPTDTFNLEKGIEIAYARTQVALATQALQKAMTC